MTNAANATGRDSPVDVATTLSEHDSQTDPDLALAKLLQEQEHAWFMMHAGSGDSYVDQLTDVERATGTDDNTNDEDDGSGDLGMAVDMQQEEYRTHLRMILDMMGRGASAQLPQGADIEDMTYEELQELGEAIGKVQVGVSEQKMRQLVMGTYEETAPRRANCHCREQCTVCQELFEKKDSVMVLPCSHVYHSECISQWLQSSKLCPICSTAVEE